MNNLAFQINTFNENLVKQLPREILEAFEQSINDLKMQKIEQNSLNVGDKMPEFTLTDALGNSVNSKNLLSKGKMVLTFYRGTWCPYCNLELKFFQDHLPSFQYKGAALVAISPQSPDHSLSLTEKLGLQFKVLTDVDNQFAKQLGISFSLQDFMLPHYKSLGIDLLDFNKNDENLLPVPAVYVVNTDNTIAYRFVDVNYMNRCNIEEVLKVL